MDDQTSDPPAPISPAKPAPPVLDYGRPTPGERNWLSRPIDPKLLRFIVTGLVGFWTFVASIGAISIPAALFVGLLAATGCWWLVPVGKWRMPLSSQVQLWISGAMILIGVVVILLRAGDGGAFSDPEYWTKDNPGFAFGPRRALRPWPIPAIGVCWLTAVVATHLFRRRRARGSDVACSGPSSPE